MAEDCNPVWEAERGLRDKLEPDLRTVEWCYRSSVVECLPALYEKGPGFETQQSRYRIEILSVQKKVLS